MAEQVKLPEFPWERIAMSGGEMPPDIPCADKIPFLSLRLLYKSYRDGIINRDQATEEKKAILHDWQLYQISEKAMEQCAEIIKSTELARAEYRKNRTLENADKLVSAIEGGKI
jgi:hypothetical protein